ncbi:MAG: dihydropteroate synthase, partial [Chloroflexota bacterium]|nr:dihydropteroate synthase [Chloroflexota bacterium]
LHSCSKSTGSVMIMNQPATVYLALGSNLGDRVTHIHRALQALTAFATTIETSFLYESRAQYINDQPDFLNAVCRISTHLTPHELLAALEETMQRLGRIRSVQYGPRSIDLDILFYEGLQLTTPDLTIPHPHLAERAFVLEPLCDIATDVRHPVLNLSMRQLWVNLKAPAMPKVMPIGNQLWTWGQKTRLMGILNITPDSFSGDGLVSSGEDGVAQTVAQSVAQAQRFVDEGADCLDVGGISTRPGHVLIPVEEEIARVVPVIQALAQTVTVPISIDTFRAEVAQAALAAGAHLINDVWGLRFDAAIATLAADAFAPLVVMHNRMQPEDAAYRARVQTMPMALPYIYADLIDDMRSDLTQSLNLAQSMGVPRWLLIIDPGVGFGKTLEQHLELLRRLAELKTMGYPLLFAASRKNFVGRVLGGLPPQERVEGTLATGVLALERGADILRVHDVRVMHRAAQMADAVVRPF